VGDVWEVSTVRAGDDLPSRDHYCAASLRYTIS
jgi:hypothetical protein